MATLVQAALRMRRTARASWGYAVAVVMAVLVIAGVFERHGGPITAPQLVIISVWALAFAVRTQPSLSRSDEPLWNLEAGALLLVGVHAIVQLSGGLHGPLYPLVYIAVALFAAFSPVATAATLIGSALVADFLLCFVTEAHDGPRTFLLHAAFIACFGLLNIVFTRIEVARVRDRLRREVADRKERARNETRLFRLVAPSSEGLRDEERLFQSSVDEVHQSLFHILDLLHQTLELHTCVLLMPADGDQLQIAELVTASDDIADGPFTFGAGAIGASVNGGIVTNLHGLRLGYGGICYYRGPAAVKSFVAVPVRERDHIRGVLCADRLEDRPFTEREEELLRKSTNHILRALENERVFLQLESSKREQNLLYRASQALGAATSQDAVLHAGVAAATEIVAHDFAAVTEYDPDAHRHYIRRAVGEDALDFQGLKFRDNASLTAMVVKNRHYLPYRGEFDSRQQVLFTKRSRLRGMSSVMVLPLIAQEEPIGTLVVAARRPGAFSESARASLQVLANQLGIAMANAKAVRQLEEMATTDGLTGCLNKRALLEELERKLRAAQRFNRKLSLLVVDLDHFKSVNDTYGHATGDRVLQELGRVLMRAKRETDIVARFGGEEFCVLCEETDARGATQLAERVREELERTQIPTDIGPLKVTASLGVATFPTHAKTAETLFEESDRALYQAKQRGRNQVCIA